jgi:signal transduction histidine kinase
VRQLLEARLIAAESRKAAKALMQSEKLAAVRQLASSMAHEINNPLEALTNLLYLSRQCATDPEMQGWLDQADQELRRVSVIANHTLRFHKQASRRQAITCISLFSTTLNIYESRIRNAGITVEKRKRANEPVECFEGDIRQVLGNIVSNAIDAMPNSGYLRHSFQPRALAVQGWDCGSARTLCTGMVERLRFEAAGELRRTER